MKQGTCLLKERRVLQKLHTSLVFVRDGGNKLKEFSFSKIID